MTEQTKDLIAIILETLATIPEHTKDAYVRKLLKRHLPKQTSQVGELINLYTTLWLINKEQAFDWLIKDLSTLIPAEVPSDWYKEQLDKVYKQWIDLWRLQQTTSESEPISKKETTESESKEIEKISTEEYNNCLMENWMIWYVQMKWLLQKKWLRVE